LQVWQQSDSMILLGRIYDGDQSFQQANIK
jgi:hypothetical protein